MILSKFGEKIREKARILLKNSFFRLRQGEKTNHFIPSVRRISPSGVIQSTANQLSIGGNTPYGEYFQGLIDEVRVSARFRLANVWSAVIKYIAPVMLVVILVAYVAQTMGLFSM